MRHTVTILAVASIAITAVVGCGGKKTEEDPTANQVPVEAPPEAPVEVVDNTPPPPPPEPEPIRISLADINFDYDKAELRSDARRVLDRNVDQLRQRDDMRVVIEGHCDERGTVEYNLALGQRRAHATMQYMIRKGVDASRITIISYGEERPVDPRQVESAWAKNRRAHFDLQEG